MTEGVSLFGPWESFNVITGSSGAALTGLQFVVMALVADAQRKGSHEAVGAFGTPTVVHFCVVLAIAAILSAPWQGATTPAVILATTGFAGIIYAGVVTARSRRQTVYKPVLEDWIWHSIIPFIAYTSLFIGAIAIERRPGLFMIGATSLLLLFTGIHNAWDSVTYVASNQFQKEPSD